METKEIHAQEKEEERTNRVAVCAYLTLIGLVAALFMNQAEREDFASFHIRQMLGLCLCGLLLGIIGLIPVVGWIVSFLGSLALFFLWGVGLINALNKKQKHIPFLGEKFDQWFQRI